jgi:hypothetical protein
MTRTHDTISHRTPELHETWQDRGVEGQSHRSVYDRCTWPRMAPTTTLAIRCRTG